MVLNDNYSCPDNIYLTIRTNPCSFWEGRQIPTNLRESNNTSLAICQKKLNRVNNISVSVLNFLLVAGSFPTPRNHYLSLMYHHTTTITPCLLSVKSMQVAKHDNIKMNDIITPVVWRKDCISYKKKCKNMYNFKLFIFFPNSLSISGLCNFLIFCYAAV